MLRKANIAKIGVVACLVLILGAVPFIGACAPGEEAPPAGKPTGEAPGVPAGAVIHLGSLADMTGPYGRSGLLAVNGESAYIDMVNAEGGVNGIPVELHVADCRVEAPRAISAFHRLVGEGVVGFSAVSSTYNEALAGISAKAKMPITAGSAFNPAGVDPPGTVFYAGPTYHDQWGAFCDWMMANWEEERPPKVGIIGWSVAFGRQIDHPNVYNYAKKVGIELVEPIEWIATGATDASAQLKRLEAKGVDAIYLQCTQFMSAVVMRDAMRLGIHPGKIQFCQCSSSVSDEQITLSGKAADGLKVVWDRYVWDELNPGMKTYIEWASKRWGPDYPWDHADSGHWAGMACLIEAVRIAVDGGNWPITSEDVFNGLCQIKDFSTGVSPGKVNFDSQRRVGHYMVRICEFRNAEVEPAIDPTGKCVPITDWFEAPQITGTEYWSK